MQDKQHPIELKPLGAVDLLIFGRRARNELAQFETDVTVPWQNWKLTQRTQAANRMALEDFERTLSEDFVRIVPHRSDDFHRYWTVVLENTFDLLSTILTFHQAPAFDALRFLESRTQALLERLTRPVCKWRPSAVPHIRPDRPVLSVEERRDYAMQPERIRTAQHMSNPLPPKPKPFRK